MEPGYPSPGVGTGGSGRDRVHGRPGGWGSVGITGDRVGSLRGRWQTIALEACGSHPHRSPCYPLAFSAPSLSARSTSGLPNFGDKECRTFAIFIRFYLISLVHLTIKEIGKQSIEMKFILKNTYSFFTHLYYLFQDFPFYNIILLLCICDNAICIR